MVVRLLFASLLLSLVSTYSNAQDPTTWQYYGLPNGPTAPRFQFISGHHQPMPLYQPYTLVKPIGPRTIVKYGWFGRFTPSPRPRTTTVGVRSSDSR